RVAPELGGEEALARLRERLAARGLRLILDFVPNHLARDHAWVSGRPEAFVQGSAEDLKLHPGDFFRGPGGRVFAHGRDPFFPGWTDTAQLNYASRPAREGMKEELLRIAGLCDGVRCDMAMLLLPDVFAATWQGRLGPEPVTEGFWPEAVAAARARHPGFLFIAEAYWGREQQMLGQGFDYAYDKWLYDRLRAGDAAAVRAHLRASMDYQRRCARFIENHDEERAARAFDGGRWLPAAAVAFGAPGLKLFHEGQLEGRKVKLPVQLGRRPAEPPDPEIAAGYRRLIAFLKEPIFREGAFSLPEVNSAGPGDSTHPQVIALLWGPPRGTGKSALVAANLDGSPACARIPLPRAARAPKWVLDDWNDGSRYGREGAEMASPGLFVALMPWQVHLFEMRPGI
ncbi:MAG: alpha-amylase family glycosyl hydrolase, partial [Nitrospinota bacterium]